MTSLEKTFVSMAKNKVGLSLTYEELQKLTNLWFSKPTNSPEEKIELMLLCFDLGYQQTQKVNYD